MLPEIVWVESLVMGRSVPVASQQPLSLPVGVPKNGPPFMGGEAREVHPGPVPDYRMEDKEMVEESALVLFVTAPEQVDRGEWEATRCLCSAKVMQVDVVHGFLPDFTCLGKPNRHWPSIADTFQLPVV
jgi:hypothetical protein